MTQRKSGNGKASGNENVAEADDAAAAEGSLDKVRDIIFGGQMRDYDRRFERLESEFQRRLTFLDDEFDKKLKHLDEFIKREFEKAQKKSVQEKKDRTDALTDLGNTVIALGSRLELRLSELDESMSAESSEIRNDIERHRIEILDDTKELLGTLTDVVRQETSELQNAKTDRLELANLFSEVAMRLNREFELPEG